MSELLYRQYVELILVQYINIDLFARLKKFGAKASRHDKMQ